MSGFLGRNGTPFRVIDPDEDAASASLLARFAPGPGDLPIVVMPDGTVLKNPTKQELARALGLVAGTLRSDAYDVAIVGAGPAGLATAVYGASEGLSILVLEAMTLEGRLAPARGSRTIWLSHRHLRAGADVAGVHPGAEVRCGVQPVHQGGAAGLHVRVLGA